MLFDVISRSHEACEAKNTANDVGHVPVKGILDSLGQLKHPRPKTLKTQTLKPLVPALAFLQSEVTDCGLALAEAFAVPRFRFRQQRSKALRSQR